MGSAGLFVGAERVDQVAVAGDVVQAVEGRCAAFLISVVDVVRRACVIVGAEGVDQVAIATM